jgi:hypothetical protein
MQRFLRHKFLIGAAAIVVVASAGGAAYAATQSSTNPRQAYINDVAKRLDVAPSKLTAAMKAALIDRLNAMVKSGKLTQAQANKLEQRIDKNGRLPFLFGPGGIGRFGHLHAGLGGPLKAATSYLGLSTAQLMNDLRSGKSLGDVAKAQGKSVSGLEQALINAEKTRLDEAVSAGRISKSQEQTRLSRLTSEIDALVNRTGLLHGPRLGSGRWGGPRQGPMMPAPQNGASAPVPNPGPPSPSA